ncbi:hypothetical protein RND81_08G006000 [Saponaria officinalis]|uniref:Cation/H+ exchanger domain-containing protein n=1 Tax=Saponaria officinalis TaxID=3572 RepID=A0AAW1J1Y9_SAPOF
MNITIQNPICYAKVVDSSHQWGDIPSLTNPLPILVLQMTLAIVINYGIDFILQYFRQPRILSNILSALLLSPSTLNYINPNLGDEVFPKDSLTILETMSNFGLLYAMFIQGLHADLTPIAQKRFKTTCLACVSFLFPFIVGSFLYIAFKEAARIEHDMNNIQVVTLYWGMVLAATSFPTLAPILANLRIFCTKIGQEALSLALFHDVLTWALVQFILAMSASSPDNKSHVFTSSTGCVLLFMLIYMAICSILLKPIISKLSNTVSKGENYICDVVVKTIMFIVLAGGFLGNYFGSHFIFAAFVLGTSVPCGLISETFILKMEDCILGVFMPLYFALMGTKIDVKELVRCFRYSSIIIIGVIAKVLCTLSCAFVSGYSIGDSFALGVLLSSKGLISIVILNIGHDRGHLTEESFELLLLIQILSTCLVGPITHKCYARRRKFNYSYTQRTLQGAKPDQELHIVTCIHTSQNVYNLISLLEISNITTKPIISIFAVHLIELLGHASPMLVEHEPRDSLWGIDSKPFFRRARNQSIQIIEAFHEFEDKKGTFDLVQMLTMVSPIDIFHEDICNLAEDKQASLIILSFHMQQGIDCRLEDTHVEFKLVNEKVMSIAPCSVALLIDRGLRTTSLTSTSIHNKIEDDDIIDIHITMVYVGGPDDREALTYASRMATHSFITLTIYRFLVQYNATECQQLNNNSELVRMRKRIKKEKEIDDKFINILLQKNDRKESIYYVEKFANTGDEIISILREMHDNCDLYVVGRDKSNVFPLISNLELWSEYRELGPLGDILVTSDFSSNSSILVVQQYSKESHTKSGTNSIDINKLSGF